MKAVVLDDMPADAARITGYLKRYQSENNVPIQISVFHSSIEFLEQFDGSYDVIFLDIEMPGCNGLEVAHEIRARDAAVGLIFITNMAQYAIRGYEVNAIDFMLKPVSYYNFSQKLEKAIRFVRSRSSRDFILANEDGISRIEGNEILYVEKSKDYLIYHTTQGTFRQRGTAKALKEQLQGLPFAECTAGCLVNLDWVSRVGKESVYLKQEQLPLSRRMKKTFTQCYIDYIGGGF